jgi:glycosyltransferase involved in cell wall biosynthesis
MDPTSIIKDARIGLMPDELGGGFKLRILSYIFQQLPVAAIATQSNGLPFSLPDGLLAAGDVTSLVAKIVNSIDDIDLLNKIKDFAYERCHREFDWISRGEALVDAIERIQGVRSHSVAIPSYTRGGR